MPFRIGPPRSNDGASNTPPPPPPPPSPPVASFTITDLNPAQAFFPKTFRFTDTSTGVVTSRSWNPGDGGVIASVDAVVDYTYQAAGTFTVIMTVSNAGGLAGQTQPVAVPAPVAAVAAFDIAATVIVVGVSTTVDVANQSTGDVAAYDLDWGDGSSETPPTNPDWIGTHVYGPTPGDFTITLTATGYDGNVSTASRIATVPPAPLVTAFTLTTLSATPGVGATIRATNATTGDLHPGAAPYVIDWGDGSSSPLAAGWTTVDHVYGPTPGTFTVTLTATGFAGNVVAATQPASIPAVTPTAGFATTILASVPGVSLTVQLANQSGGNPVSYTVDWGDGQSEPLGTNWATVQHVYGATPGDFTITLTAYNALNASSVATAVVTVAAFTPPVAAFTATILSSVPGVGVTVRVLNASTGTISSYHLSYGNGATVTPALDWTALDYSYGPTAGDFTIALTASGPGGSSSVATFVVTVPPIGSYSGAAVPLRALNGSAYALNEPVAVSVPFARSGPLDTAKMQVLTSQGLPVPTHFRVLSRWDALRNDVSAPIRMLQVVFPATMPVAAVPATELPGEEIVASETTYVLATDWRAPRPVGDVVLTATAAEYTVTIGATSFVVKRATLSPVDRATVGATSVFTNGRVVFADNGGTVAATGVVTMIEQGALGANTRVVLKQTGLLGGLKFCLWLTFDHNHADFDARFLLRNPLINQYDAVDAANQLAGWTRHYYHARMRDAYYRYVNKLYLAWDAAQTVNAAVTDAATTPLTGSDDYRLMSQVELLKRSGGQGATQSDYATRSIAGKTRTDTWHLATKVEGKNTTFSAATDTRYVGALGVQCGGAHVMLAMQHFWERGPHSFEAKVGSGNTLRIGMFPEDLPGRTPHSRCWALRNDGYNWRMGTLPPSLYPAGVNPRTGAAWTAYDTPPDDFPSATSHPPGSPPPAEAYQRQLLIANVRGFVAAATSINVANVANGDYVVATAANVDGGNAVGDLLRIADKTAVGTARYNSGQRIVPREGMYFVSTAQVDSGGHFPRLYFFQAAATPEADATKWILHGPASPDKVWRWQDRNLATNQPSPGAATQIQAVRASVNAAITVPQLAAVKRDDVYLAAAANLFGLTHAVNDLLIPVADGTFAGATVVPLPTGSTFVSFYDDAAFQSGVGQNGLGRKHYKLLRSGAGTVVTAAGAFDPAWTLRVVVSGALQTTGLPIVPNHATCRTNYTVQGGRGVSCRMRVGVGLGAVPTGADNRRFAAPLRQEPLGLAPAALYRTTKALGGEEWHERPTRVDAISPDHDLQRHERWTKSLAYDSACETGLNPLPTLEFGFPAMQRLGGTKGNLVVNRSIGWDLYGEVLAGGVGMTTASYDPLRSLWLGLLYFDGDYQFFRNSRPVATFLKDLGFQQSEMYGGYLGNFQFYESGSQYGDGARVTDPAHTWFTGLVYEYLLLGDEAAYATIDLVVRTGCMRGNAAPSAVPPTGELRQLAWPLFSMADAYAALGPVVGDNGKTLLQELRDGLKRFVDMDKGLVNASGIAVYGPTTWVPNAFLNTDDYPNGDPRFVSEPKTVSFGTSAANATPTVGRDYKNNGLIYLDRANGWSYTSRLWMYEIVLNAFLKISRVDPAFDIDAESGIYADWRALMLKMVATLKTASINHGSATRAVKTPYHFATRDRATAFHEMAKPAVSPALSVVEVFGDMSDELQTAGMFYAAWKFFQGSQWEEDTSDPDSVYARALESFRVGVRYNLGVSCRVPTAHVLPSGTTVTNDALPIDRPLTQAIPENRPIWATLASLGSQDDPAIYDQTTGEPAANSGITKVSMLPVADIVGKVYGRNLTRESAPQLAALLIDAGAIDP